MAVTLTPPQACAVCAWGSRLHPCHCALRWDASCLCWVSAPSSHLRGRGTQPRWLQAGQTPTSHRRESMPGRGIWIVNFKSRRRCPVPRFPVGTTVRASCPEAAGQGVMEPEVTTSWQQRNLRTGARGHGRDPRKVRPLCLVDALRGVKAYQILSWRERDSVQRPPLPSAAAKLCRRNACVSQKPQLWCLQELPVALIMSIRQRWSHLGQTAPAGCPRPSQTRSCRQDLLILLARKPRHGRHCGPR